MRGSAIPAQLAVRTYDRSIWTVRKALAARSQTIERHAPTASSQSGARTGFFPSPRAERAKSVVRGAEFWTSNDSALVAH